MKETSNRTSRRSFLKSATTGAVLSLTAASRARAQGANDRIRIALIGCGQRGGAHMTGVYPFAKEQNVEVVAVCDPWKVPREAMADRIKEMFGTDPMQFGTYRDVVARDDIDAVMIASCDHQHVTHLDAATREKKDAYCEKPVGIKFERVKAVCDLVKAQGTVVQVGTQLRSMTSMTGARDLYATGIMGKVARVEQCRNGNEPYWYSRLKEVREEDTDWDEFLMDAPKRPFNASQYSAWYGYRDFTDGPVPNLGCHYIDLVHYITGCGCPTNAVCLGNSYVWNDEHKFTCPDHVQAMWEYPEGFMVSYSTNFGNGAGNSFKIFGEHGTMDLLQWSDPQLLAEGMRKGAEAVVKPGPIPHVECPDHFLNWLQCLRTRETPNASIDAGYQHCVAVNMAMMAYDTGQRHVYDADARTISVG